MLWKSSEFANYRSITEEYLIPYELLGRAYPVTLPSGSPVSAVAVCGTVFAWMPTSVGGINRLAILFWGLPGRT